MNRTVKKVALILLYSICFAVPLIDSTPPEPAAEPVPRVVVEPPVSIPATPLIPAKVIPTEYEAVHTVYNTLVDAGFSLEAAAGIIGNMMTESGGHTLALQPNIVSADGSYYGVCQWSKKYAPQVHGMPLTEQLEYLLQSIEAEFEVFGHIASSTFEDFKTCTDVEHAAYVFAKVYERCSSSTYTVRQEDAVVAFEYFTDWEA